MYNPYLNGSDTTETTSNEQSSQTSISNQHLQQIHQEQPDEQPQRHEDYQPQQVGRNKKHILYIDDYIDNPPSYTVAQENYQIPQTSDADARAATFPNSIEDIPLDPYHAHSPTEPETAPLMYEQNEHIQTNPSADRVEIITYNPFDKSRRVRQCSITRLLLGFAIFAFGITLMATTLATLKCYNHCEEDGCPSCRRVTHKGIMASGFVFFISTSLCILWKIIKFTVY